MIGVGTAVAMGKEVKPECTKDILTESQKAKLLRETEASEGEHFARAGDHMRKNSPNPKPLKPENLQEPSQNYQTGTLCWVLTQMRDA